MIAECLEKASHDLGFARDSLQEALKDAKAVDGIVIMQLIEDLAKLDKKVDQFREAWTNDNGI